MPRKLISIENQLIEKIQFRATKAVNERLRAIAKKKLRPKSFVICEALNLYFTVLDENND